MELLPVVALKVAGRAVAAAAAAAWLKVSHPGRKINPKNDKNIYKRLQTGSLN